MINNKGFTLVELIVVITMLSILWTISFLSLKWYSAEQTNYPITVKYDGWVYYTDSYTKVGDNCIEFVEKDDYEMTVCWEYIIKEPYNRYE